MKYIELVTLSRNKITGDRSYCNSVFYKCGENSSHIKLQSVDPNFYTKNVLLLKDEYDFTDARELVGEAKYKIICRKIERGII